MEKEKQKGWLGGLWSAMNRNIKQNIVYPGSTLPDVTVTGDKYAEARKRITAINDFVRHFSNDGNRQIDREYIVKNYIIPTVRNLAKEKTLEIIRKPQELTIEGLATVPLGYLGGAKAVKAASKLVSGVKNVFTPGSAFWNNPLTKGIAASIAGGNGIDAASKFLTGNTWGENVGGLIEGTTGWNPRSNAVGEFVTDASNPGYLLSYGRAAKGVESAVENIVKARDLFNSPLTGKWTQIGNKEYRLSPNVLAGNIPVPESRYSIPEKWLKNGWSYDVDGVPKNPNGIRFVHTDKDGWISEKSLMERNKAFALKSRVETKVKDSEKKINKILSELKELGFKEFNPRLWFQGRDWMNGTPGAVTKEDVNIWNSHLPEYLRLAKKLTASKKLYQNNRGKWVGKFTDGEMEVVPEEYIVANSKAFKDAGLYYDGQKWISGMSQKQFNELLNNGGINVEKWASNNSGAKSGGNSVSAAYGEKQVNMVGKGNNEKLIQSPSGAQASNFYGGNSIGAFIDPSYDATHFTVYYDNLSKGYGETKVFSPHTQIKVLRGNNGDFNMNKFNPFKSLLIPLSIGGTAYSTMESTFEPTKNVNHDQR